MSDAAAQAVPSQGKTLRRLFLTLFLRGRAMRLANQRGASSAANQKKASSIGSRLGIMLVVYAAFGISVAGLRDQPLFVLALVLHALILLTVGMFVASSAGEVLFNRDETEILQHRPVDPGTMLWSKLAILVQVSLWIAGAVSFAGLITGTFFSKHGGAAFAIAQIAATVLSAIFLASTITVIYQLCLRWFGRERLDSLMTLVQVLATIGFVGAAQLAPRMLETADGMFFRAIDAWWMALLPPAWFAGFVDAIGGSHAAASWRLGVIGVAATALLGWLAVRGLSHSFEEGVQKLAERTRRRPSTGGGALKRLVNAAPLLWWLRTDVERSAFLLTAAHLFRDRDTKLRIYPAIAPSLIMPVVMLGSTRSSDGMMSVWPVAFAGLYLGIVPFTALPLLQRSENWRAVEAFRVTPLTSPAALVAGARRAVIVLLTLPMAVLFTGIVLAVTGGKAPLELLIPGLISIPFFAMLPCVYDDSVPFSQAPDASTPARRTASTIGIMFLDMALAFGAAFAYTRGMLWWFIGVEAVLVVATYLVMRREASRIQWTSLG